MTGATPRVERGATAAAVRALARLAPWDPGHDEELAAALRFLGWNVESERLLQAGDGAAMVACLAVLAPGIALVGPAPPLLVVALAAIWLRGYLVPGTPELTKRYLPERALALFGKAPAATGAAASTGGPESVGAVGLVTGEAIGQKSSQTSANIMVTDAAVDLPVFRPNLTDDKAEITQRAREIGTFAESTIPTGCNRVAPSFPETNAALSNVRVLEPDDLFERARDAADSAEVVTVES